MARSLLLFRDAAEKALAQRGWSLDAFAMDCLSDRLVVVALPPGATCAVCFQVSGEVVFCTKDDRIDDMIQDCVAKMVERRNQEIAATRRPEAES